MILDRRDFLRTGLVLAAGGRLGAAPAPPNVLFIVADDLGWADVGYHESRLRTPNIDRLARGGTELHQHYVAPLCTPTRAALLSGRYWSRFGNTAPQAEQVMPFGTVTLASAVKSLGYQTCITGKWHLGSLPEWGPRRFGFDRSYGALGGGTGPWDHRYKKGVYTRNWHRNDQYVDEQGHVTDLIAREACDFLQKLQNGPFLLYVPFTAVHHPIEEPREWLDRNSDIPENRRQYAACVQHMDDAIGGILAALDKTGRRDNTLIFFTSDNGGMGQPASDLDQYPGKYKKGGILGENQPLRGHKGQVYEGGVRVPAIVNWPGRIPVRRLDAPIHAVDWLPTISRLAGFRPAIKPKWDGRDVWSVLDGTAKPQPREFYWKGPNARSWALRSGDAKLVIHEAPKRRVELFDLAADPYEKNDRAAADPAAVQRLEGLLAVQRTRDDDAVVPRRSGAAPA